MRISRSGLYSMGCFLILLGDGHITGAWSRPASSALRYVGGFCICRRSCVWGRSCTARRGRVNSQPLARQPSKALAVSSALNRNAQIQ
jgi:hypothetical protein